MFNAYNCTPNENATMCFANHTAALTVSRMGAMPSLSTADEVKEFMKKHNN